MSTLKVGTIQDHTNSNTAISIDSGGKVTLPQLVHFHGNRQTYSVEEVAGLVPFNTVRDSHSAWNNTNKQFTVPVTGVYHIGFLNIGDSTVDSSPQSFSLPEISTLRLASKLTLINAVSIHGEFRNPTASQ